VDPYVISLLAVALVAVVLDVVSIWITRVIALEWYERQLWQ